MHMFECKFTCCPLSQLSQHCKFLEKFKNLERTCKVLSCFNSSRKLQIADKLDKKYTGPYVWDMSAQISMTCGGLRCFPYIDQKYQWIKLRSEKQCSSLVNVCLSVVTMNNTHQPLADSFFIYISMTFKI